MEDAEVLDFLRRRARRALRHLGLHRRTGAGRRRAAEGQPGDDALGLARFPGATWARSRSSARVVADGKFISGGGVTAGIDMAWRSRPSSWASPGGGNPAQPGICAGAAVRRRAARDRHHRRRRGRTRQGQRQPRRSASGSCSGSRRARSPALAGVSRLPLPRREACWRGTCRPRRSHRGRCCAAGRGGRSIAPGSRPPAAPRPP